MKNKIIMYPRDGLGNLLFRYFVMYSISKDYNFDIYFKKDYKDWRGDMNNYSIFSHLNFIDTDFDYLMYNEKEFSYNPIILENKNYNINGYYQSYKYSEKYIDEIRNILFSNIIPLYQKIESLYNQYKENFKTCLIHVRRGDYLNLQHIHPVLPDEYYLKAISLFPDHKFFIFSDDSNFLSTWNIIKNINCKIVDLNEPEELLIFMSLCDNFIIANSSLSLSSYLLRKNKNAKLVAPRKWFNNLKFDINDLVPPDTILI